MPDIDQLMQVKSSFLFDYLIFFREMAMLVARLLATAALGSDPDITQKYKMGHISKGVANKL
jgi:hypothetical protein